MKRFILYEDQMIIAGYNSGTPVQEIANKLERHKRSIEARAKILKIQHSSNDRFFTPHQDKIIIDNWTTLSRNDIAKMISKTANSVSTRACVYLKLPTITN